MSQYMHLNAREVFEQSCDYSVEHLIRDLNIYSSQMAKVQPYSIQKVEDYFAKIMHFDANNDSGNKKIQKEDDLYKKINLYPK